MIREKQRTDKSLIIERRDQLLRQGSALELSMIRQDLPERLQRAERRVARSVGEYFGVDSVMELQRALNARGAHDGNGRRLQESGRLDPGTVYALFSYLQHAQDLPNERRAVSLMLTQLRAAIYPYFQESAHTDDWSAMISITSARDNGLQAFLFSAGYRDFRNEEIDFGRALGPRELFGLLSFAAGVSGTEARDIVSRRSVRISDLVPARLVLPRILFPVSILSGESSAEGTHGHIEWHRGSYGSHSHRSGRIHHAIDIFAPLGRQVVAPISGQVVHVGTDPNSPGGNVVVIRSDGGLSALMSHLDTIGVSEGQWIERGHPVGTVGHSGRGLDGTPVTASHLHFEVFEGEVVRGGRSLRIRRRASHNPADLFE